MMILTEFLENGSLDHFLQVPYFSVFFCWVFSFHYLGEMDLETVKKK